MSDNKAGTKEASVDALMRGAVDLHCHSGPSVMARLVDHIDAVEQAAAAGMRAVLFKDHYYPTAPIVELIRKRYAHLGVEPLGAIVLNNALGGFNAYAVEHALKMGSKVVWMPTVSAANHIREGHNKKLLVAKSEMRRATALSVVNEHGDLRDEVKPILDLVAEHDAVLSCGHLHISEVWPLLRRPRAAAAAAPGQPPDLHGRRGAEGLSPPARARRLYRALDLHVRQLALQVFTPEQLKSYIDAAGVDRTFFGSNLGQENCPSPSRASARSSACCSGSAMARRTSARW